MRKIVAKLKAYRYETILGVITVALFCAYLAAYLSGLPLIVAG